MGMTHEAIQEVPASAASSPRPPETSTPDGIDRLPQIPPDATPLGEGPVQPAEPPKRHLPPAWFFAPEGLE